jgi:hypothetical protein
LLPSGDEFAVRLKNLYAVIRAVGDVDTARRIERDAVRSVEFAWRLAMLAPFHEEFPVL